MAKKQKNNIKSSLASVFARQVNHYEERDINEREFGLTGQFRCCIRTVKCREKNNNIVKNNRFVSKCVNQLICKRATERQFES